MEGAGILSELHPVAAGVYNTAVFVIIPHRKGGAQNGTEHFGGSLDKENSGPSTAKPKYTYRELIKKALLQKQFLNLGGIYKWICTNFPYYSVTDDKWKNSIQPAWRCPGRHTCPLSCSGRPSASCRAPSPPPPPWRSGRQTQAGLGRLERSRTTWRDRHRRRRTPC